MTTITELDDRLREVAGRRPHSKYTDKGSFEGGELVLFTSDLHTLLLSEGFHSIYEPVGGYYSEVLHVQVGNSYVTVMISYMTYIDIEWAGAIQEAHTVRGLIDLLHDIPRLREVRDYCSMCHYSGGNGTYCGVGRPLVTGGCGGYIGRTQL